MDSSAQKTKKVSDAELLQRYRQGEESAFREIVNRYKNSLYAFLRRFLNQQELVEDVFQETFLQLYASRDSFDTDRPLRPWLFTIAANKAKDALRKGQRHNAVSLGAIAEAGEATVDDIVNLLQAHKTTPDQEFDRSETARRVHEIIGQMPENLRAAHDRNDETLERIYIGRRFKNDTERLEKLFEMYTKMTTAPSTRGKRG